MNSYYRCEFAGRHVTVWPSITGESGFYDVVIGSTTDEGDQRTVTRLTACEAAAYVLSELGTPYKLTLASLEGMIRAWRAEFDNLVREPA